MSDDRALRLRKWVRFGDTVTITLTHSPAGDGPEAERLHRAVGAFVHALSASPDQAAVLSREDVARLIEPRAWMTVREIAATKGLDAANPAPGVIIMQEIDQPVVAMQGLRDQSLTKADQIIALLRETPQSNAEGGPALSGEPSTTPDIVEEAREAVARIRAFGDNLHSDWVAAADMYERLADTIIALRAARSPPSSARTSK